MPRPRRRNPWTSTGEILIWILFVGLLFPAGFAGWAVGRYTSLGRSPSTVVHTVTVGSASMPATTGTTSTKTITTGPSSSGNATAGRAVFLANTCATCHTFKPAGASGNIGPDLDTAPAADAKADHNMALAAFVKESIVDPDAYIAKGYTANIMPKTFGTKLSPAQLNDLVAFILSGTAKS